MILKNITSGLGVARIRLPIRLFEPRSFTERVVDRFVFAPIFLNRAAETGDRLERLRLAITFLTAGLYVAGSHDKPFNPILGETYQGNLSDGS